MHHIGKVEGCTEGTLICHNINFLWRVDRLTMLSLKNPLVSTHEHIETTDSRLPLVILAHLERCATHLIELFKCDTTTFLK